MKTRLLLMILCTISHQKEVLKMSNLFSPIKIGNVLLKNRVIFGPIGTKPEIDGSITNESISYYEERAKGGVGMVITAANLVCTDYEPRAELQTTLTGIKNVDRLTQVVEHCHPYGTKVFVQITPGAGRTGNWGPNIAPDSASADNTSFWYPELHCHELTVDEIHHIEDKMAEAAHWAQVAGADGVEIHGYGGYLLDQFESTLWNHRTDEYGGSFENRMRFAVEIVKKIKQRCGQDFPISMKFSATHGIKGGRTIDEGIKMAQLFEKIGCDDLHVDTGCYEAWYRTIPTVYEKPGFERKIGRQIKQAVDIPVMLQGKLKDPRDAIAAMEDQDTDFVILAHQLLADPYWTKKVQAGEFDKIVPCIGCNACTIAIFNGQRIQCAVNPLCMHENEYRLHPATSPKRILVIGGGPAGMEAAITAKRRGFGVEIWEKSNRLGGNLYVAGYPSFKKDIRDFCDFLEHEIALLDIPVHYHYNANPEAVLAGRFDKVIVATGAHSFIPGIPGAKENAVVAEKTLTSDHTDSHNTVIIGGGLVGCEAALDMAIKGVQNVTIVEASPAILSTGQDAVPNKISLTTRLHNHNVKIVTGARVEQITDHSVDYSVNGRKISVDCDLSVIATGYRPNNDLVQALAGKIDVTVIGDAVRPRNVLDAIHEAYHTIRVY